MPAIRHRVGIAVPQSRVYEMLATTSGLSQWWTTHVEGESQPGGTLRFFFTGSEPSAVMRVSELTSPHHVKWECIGGPDEWVGTQLTFDLTSTDKETALLFTHADWQEPVAFMYHCSTKWGYFMLGLKALLEGGPSSAYPNDMPISSWG